MIECNPQINFGMPALKGRRLTVYNIVTKLYYEGSVAEVLSDYSITMEDAKEALDYCINLKCKEDPNLVHFCEGCLLRTFDEGWDFKKTDYVETEIDNQKIVISKDKKIY